MVNIFNRLLISSHLFDAYLKDKLYKYLYDNLYKEDNNFLSDLQNALIDNIDSEYIY